MSETLPNVLLVEDDPQDRLDIRLQLEVMGLVVYDTPSVGEAEELIRLRDYSLVLLHLGHEPLESLRVCTGIRANSTVPIIMMAQRDEAVDVEMVMSAGADDYVKKPVLPRILVSRVTQQLKRGESQRSPRANILGWGDLEMNRAQHTFKIRDTVVSLTPTEYRFLQLLMAKPKRVFSRRQIMDAIPSLRGGASESVVDNHASRLRIKIRDNGGPDVIKVVRSVGFKLADDSE